jgi:hypothetical protein
VKHTAWVLAGLMLIAACGEDGSSEDRQGLSEEEIKSTLEELPYRYRFQEVPYSGGALVVGTASDGRSVTHFAVLSDDPQFDEPLPLVGPCPPGGGRCTEIGMGGGGAEPNDLFLRLSHAGRPRPAVEARLIDALCEEREGEACGV